MRDHENLPTVQSDNEMLDRVASGDIGLNDGELGRLLAQWRDETDPYDFFVTEAKSARKYRLILIVMLVMSMVGYAASFVLSLYGSATWAASALVISMAISTAVSVTLMRR